MLPVNLEQLHDLADALTDPHQHSERIEYWDASRHRKFRTHVTTQAGLLAQLAELMLPSGAAEPGDGVAGSRPPGRWDAMATHAQITADAARWCWNLELDQRETVESNIRQLVGVFPSLDFETRGRLLKAVRQWHRMAEIVAGWKTAPLDLRAPCPALVERDGVQVVCEERALRVNLADTQAFCAECKTEWDSTNIGLLADAVRAYRAAGDAAAEVVRAKVRAAKQAERGAA